RQRVETRRSCQLCFEVGHDLITDRRDLSRRLIPHLRQNPTMGCIEQFLPCLLCSPLPPALDDIVGSLGNLCHGFPPLNSVQPRSPCPARFTPSRSDKGRFVDTIATPSRPA